MNRIDGFLSKWAQRVSPTALVMVLDEGTEKETWVVRDAPHEDIGLGINFGEAKRAMLAALNAHDARKKDDTL